MSESTVATGIANQQVEEQAPVPSCSLGTYLMVVLGFALSFVVLGALV